MKIFFTMKKLGKRATFIEREPWELPETQQIPATLRDLLILLVRDQVKRFNERKTGQAIRFFYSEEEIQTITEQSGKISFGNSEDNRTANEMQAIQTAIQAYEDGLFRVFIEKASSENASSAPMELTDLNAPLNLKEGDILTFIKLVMLAGRRW